MSSVERFENAEVRGFLQRPQSDCAGGLALTHGAGANCAAPLLVALAEAFGNAGIAVLRFDLPFRRRRPFGPPPPATAAADREGIRAAVATLRAIVPGSIYLGGHSYGGRQATILAAEEPETAAALLLLSYPLHPPGKPAELRTAHFPRLRTRCLFVHGTADPFGSLEEMRAAVAMIPAPTRIIPVEGAGHDLRRGRFDLRAVAAIFLEG